MRGNKIADNAKWPSNEDEKAVKQQYCPDAQPFVFASKANDKSYKTYADCYKQVLSQNPEQSKQAA